MTICVNGVEIDEESIMKEFSSHTAAADPRKAAIEALILREVLLQTARSKLAEDATGALLSVSKKTEIDTEAFIEEALIEQLIEREIVKPKLADQECENYYKNNPEQFRSGDLIEASHILFEVPSGPVNDSLRCKANEILQLVLKNPEKFAELARAHSNCTSASLGGNLGQLSLGDTVPEFEKVVFSLAEGEICNELVETQFGLHIVKVAHRAEGRVFPYDMVKKKLEAHLLEQKGKRALRQYLRKLISKATITGIDFDQKESAVS